MMTSFLDVTVKQRRCSVYASRYEKPLEAVNEYSTTKIPGLLPTNFPSVQFGTVCVGTGHYLLFEWRSSVHVLTGSCRSVNTSSRGADVDVTLKNNVGFS